MGRSLDENIIVMCEQFSVGMKSSGSNKMEKYSNLWRKSFPARIKPRKSLLIDGRCEWMLRAPRNIISLSRWLDCRLKSPHQ